MNLAWPTIFLLISTMIFFGLERVFPGRKLPAAKGWYKRAILVNAIQLFISFALNKWWIKWLGGYSIFNLSQKSFFVQGLLAWLVGTFFFYWWHRLRHTAGFWLIFHQVHHSPSRIELLTSFYKHPIEILVNSFFCAVILYVGLGAALPAAFWYNFFAGTGEYFYHSNLKTPTWLRYFIQTPELHSIHHESKVHKYNYADLPIWDRLFGTYKDTLQFRSQCGFGENREQKLVQMFLFKDVEK